VPFATLLLKQQIEPHHYAQEQCHEIGNCTKCGSDLEADGNHLDDNGKLVPIDDPFNVLGLPQDGAA
jgi:hypothetical protein